MNQLGVRSSDGPLLGVFLPQPQMGDQPAEISRFVRGLEDLGAHHVLAYDHVLHGRRGAESGNHEPLTLLSFLAAHTQRMRLMTAVIILPQRQAVLVAKQASTVDLLSGGRLTLGVGIGWNNREYRALNEDFATRAGRIEEQIDVLRALWSGASGYAGREHRFENSLLQPLPLQRPIPVWIGANAEVALRRGARIGDGLFINTPAGERAERDLHIIRDELTLRERDAATFGLDGRVTLEGDDPDHWRREIAWWREQGVGQVTLVTTAGHAEIDLHLHQVEAAMNAARGL